MRLIDADALGVGRCSKDILPAAYCAGWNGLVNLINDAPTIDAVLVCRCKDCKRFFEYRPDYKRNRVEGADGDCLDRIINSDNRQFQGVKYNDFCSYGERKEADGNDA